MNSCLHSNIIIQRQSPNVFFYNNSKSNLTIPRFHKQQLSISKIEKKTNKTRHILLNVWIKKLYNNRVKRRN